MTEEVAVPAWMALSSSIMARTFDCQLFQLMVNLQGGVSNMITCTAVVLSLWQLTLLGCRFNPRSILSRVPSEPPINE